MKKYQLTNCTSKFIQTIENMNHSNPTLPKQKVPEKEYHCIHHELEEKALRHCERVLETYNPSMFDFMLVKKE